MQPCWCNVAVVTVTAIFYVWRAHALAGLGRQRRLRERVAYLLWVAADRAGACGQLAEAD
jgi:hypothetical protein